MQKEALTKETGVDKFVSRSLSLILKNRLRGAKNNLLVAAARSFRRRKLDVDKPALEEISKSTIDYVNDMTGANLKPPKIIMDPRKKRSLGIGHFDPSTPKKIFINPHQEADMIVTTAVHEIVHYARAHLDKGERNPKRMTAMLFMTSLEEGIAVFISNYLEVAGSGFESGKILRHNDNMYKSLIGSVELYDSIKADLNSEFPRPIYTFAHITERLSNWLGPYSVGSAITSLLLVANNFDTESTVMEMLKSSNRELMSRVLDIVEADNGTLRRKLESLHNLKTSINLLADSIFEGVVEGFAEGNNRRVITNRDMEIMLGGISPAIIEVFRKT